MFDLLIRDGLIYDGNGGDPYRGDVAISGDKIAAVGTNLGAAKQTINANGKMVTPGFIDVHTHYDGQVTWDPYLQPSTYHGVTTAIMGNCGVGFAPCAPEKRDWLIGLMEGVEDIPGSVLAEGIKWNWETFPDFMNAIEQSPLALDVGLQIPHAALRTYVMGQRGADLEPASESEIKRMGALAVEAINAGAIGFTTSRTEKHRDKNGAHTPTYEADASELLGIAKAVGENQKGVFQLIGDFHDFEPEFALIRQMVEVSKRPLSVTIEQDDRHPGLWKQIMDGLAKAQVDGLPMKGQVPPRPTGVLQGLTSTLNPFVAYQIWRQEVAPLSLPEQVQLLRNPEFRQRLLAEEFSRPPEQLISLILTGFHKLYALGETPDYEPHPDQSVAAIAKAQGKDPREVALDLMLEDQGHALLYTPLFNYTEENLDDVRYMLSREYTAFGLGDGGAHVGILCDASFPTTLLTHWGRDRSRGETLPLPFIVKGLTKDNAQLIGLSDRGVLSPGQKADINIIDFDQLKLKRPEIVYDLPTGGKRLVQKAQGYDTTIVSGQVAFENGQPTGVLAGKLIRA